MGPMPAVSLWSPKAHWCVTVDAALVQEEVLVHLHEGLDRAILHELLHDLLLIGTKAVGRSDLVDVIGMNMVIGAAGNGLAFAPTHGPAVHHTAGLRAGLVPLLARERVAVIRHNPSTSQEPPGTIEAPTAAALLVVLVTRQQVLG